MQFNRDTKYKTSRDFGPKPKMHKAICSECGIGCEVPFKPAGQKPIFCRPCFAKNSDAGELKPLFKSPFSKPTTGGAKAAEGNYDEQFAILNAKLDMILKALAPKPTTYKKPATAPGDEWAPRKFIKPKKEFRKWGAK